MGAPEHTEERLRSHAKDVSPSLSARGPGDRSSGDDFVLEISGTRGYNGRMLERIAAVLRQKKTIQTLLPDLTTEVVRLVPAEWMRYDLEDQGKLWSRSIKPGSDPVRPGLGEVPRLGSREVEYAREIEGGFEACLLLGIGEPTGRLLLRRKSPAYSEEDLRRLRPIADVLTLGLRARPFEPPPKPRGPFEDGPLI
jgi:hypothetical protein